MKRRPNAIVLGVVAMSVVLLVVLLASLRPRSGVPLSSDNPSPSGAQALARVLEAHGVDVRRTGSLAALRGAGVDTNTTVLLTNDTLVPQDEQQDFLDIVHEAGTIVVVDPSPQLRDALFDDEAGASHRGPVFTSSGSERPRMIAVNDPEVLTNASVDEADNARLALTALGEQERLVWISTWNGAGAPTAGLDWPRWKTPLTWAAVLSVLLLVLVRGRRFGRLSDEPMPVTVKAIESTRALASLYLRASARDSAATALRDGTASRVGAGLGLAPGHRSPGEVADALRTRTTPADEPDAGHALAARLNGSPPHDDKALVELARDLDRLEKEILR